MGNLVRFYADVMALHQEVTGSCILVTIKFPNETSKKVLIDCGLFQEQEYSTLNTSLPFDVTNINHVIVTHNHVDHTGRLPLLVKNGYRGEIHMSNTTSKLIKYALEDSYKVLSYRAKAANEHPLYSDSDVDETLKLVKGHPFNESIWIDNNIKLTFFMNGHLPGAIIILMQVRYWDNSSDKHYEDINILFTGDYNNKNMFFDVEQVPKWVHQLPLTIIQESTYGDMNSTDIEYIFEKNILDAVENKKEIIIPVFSLGRSQEILYVLKLLKQQGKLAKDFPIYLDGKLANRYTSLYINDGLDNKEEFKDFLKDSYIFVTDCDMRKTIMNDGIPKIILTTSGMGSYGPAQTYIPSYLNRSNALIHFTGYCAENTLGRRLYDCKKDEIVETSGLKIKKLADVEFTAEFSAHAKADELIDFLRPFEDIRFLLVNHGESSVKDQYANKVLNEINPKNVGILGRDYWFRIDGYGFIKSWTTKF